MTALPAAAPGLWAQGLAAAAAWDLQVMAAVRAELLTWPAPAVSAVALLSHLGDRWFIAALGALACAWLAWRGEVWRAAAAGALLSGQGLAVWALKDLAMRARPPQGAIDAAWGVVVHGYSLPSGHATAALVGYGLLAWLALHSGPPAWRQGAPRAAIVLGAGLLAAGVGCSRIALGVHYPTDVLAAWCLGGLWLAGSVALLRALPAPQGRSARRA